MCQDVQSAFAFSRLHIVEVRVDALKETLEASNECISTMDLKVVLKDVKIAVKVARVSSLEGWVKCGRKSVAILGNYLSSCPTVPHSSFQC